MMKHKMKLQRLCDASLRLLWHTFDDSEPATPDGRGESSPQPGGALGMSVPSCIWFPRSGAKLVETECQSRASFERWTVQQHLRKGDVVREEQRYLRYQHGKKTGEMLEERFFVVCPNVGTSQRLAAGFWSGKSCSSSCDHTRCVRIPAQVLEDFTDPVKHYRGLIRHLSRRGITVELELPALHSTLFRFFNFTKQPPDDWFFTVGFKHIEDASLKAISHAKITTNNNDNNNNNSLSTTSSPLSEFEWDCSMFKTDDYHISSLLFTSTRYPELAENIAKSILDGIEVNEVVAGLERRYAADNVASLVSLTLQFSESCEGSLCVPHLFPIKYWGQRLLWKSSPTRDACHSYIGLPSDKYYLMQWLQKSFSVLQINDDDEGRRSGIRGTAVEEYHKYVRREALYFLLVVASSSFFPPLRWFNNDVVRLIASFLSAEFDFMRSD